MRALQTCGKMLLQGGVKTLSAIEAGVNISLLVVGTIAIAFVLTLEEFELEKRQGDWKFYARLISWGYSYLYGTTSIILSQRLFTYSSHRNSRGVLILIIVSCIMHTICIVNYILYSIFVRWSQPATMAAFFIFILYKTYFLWVGICYLKEIKNNEVLSSSGRSLSDDELENVLGWIPSEGHDWNLKISFSSIRIDEETPLGKGAFGIVYKAVLTQNLKQENVAVKTVANNADATLLTALISELKIMTMVGRNDNIVNLLGACISDEKNPQFYVVVELCELGNIGDHLRLNRELYIARLWTEQMNSTIPSAASQYVTISTADEELRHTSTFELLQWCMQTASGMAFIASKKIIHGDLAARNVLLTKDKQVKISDFGLSRHLRNYSTYVKTKDVSNGDAALIFGYSTQSEAELILQDLIPWKWMSIEALCHQKFSTQSDVWSFGVTVWEYFTCGSTPYPGWVYSEEFVKLLACGQLRPEPPEYVCEEIYEMLKQCWELEPNRRPSFEQLKQFFERRIGNYRTTYRTINNTRPEFKYLKKLGY